MGKTLLSMMLVRLLKKKDFPIVQITDPHCGFSGILRQTAALLGVDAHLSDEETLLTEVYVRLNARDSRQVISIIIDDAQELGVAALVRLRAFANFNRDGFFPLQLIFFAHPSFTALLKDPQLAAMDQRIKRRHRLTPLTLQETREYIYFRLVKSGAPGAPFFADDAIREIHSLTGGVPRLINNICDASLTRGASRLETGISLEIVREARSDQAESFVPRVVAAARLGGTEPHDRFMAPPVQIAQPQKTGEVYGPSAAHAPVTARSRKIWLPVTVAAVLALFFIVRLYGPGTPPGPIMSRDISPQKVLPEQPTAAAPAAVEEVVVPEQPAAAAPVVVEEVVVSAQPIAAVPVAAEEVVVPEQPAAVPAFVAEQAMVSEQPAAAAPAVVEEALLSEQPVAAVPVAVEEAVLPEQVVAAVPVAVEEAVLPEQVVAAAPAVVDAALVPGQPVEPADVFGDIAAVPDDGRPFTLRLGCFNSPESARTAASVYALHSPEPFIARVNLQQQGRWWIFYAGSFASREEAKRIREQLALPDADVISMPYACRIGVFDSATMETALLAALEKIGCAPYVLENGDGTFSLFAGLYRQYDNAEILRKALADIHIGSTVVFLRPGTSPLPGKDHTGALPGPAS
jgi:type II secretory pathway predicted ATPase ExeA